MKLVKENINFERGHDPLQSIGIGLYTKIKEWVSETHIFRIPYNPDDPEFPGTYITKDIFDYITIKNLQINANCWVDISADKYKRLPEYIKFNHLYDNFACQLNIIDDYWKKPFPKIIDGDLSFYMPAHASRHVTESEIREICKVGGKIRIKISGKW